MIKTLGMAALDVIPFLGRKTTESGEENAQRFVRVLEKEAKSRRFLQFTNGANSSKNYKHCGDWHWMPHPLWRERVLELIALKELKLRRAEFIEPDALEGWTFDAVSLEGTHVILTLTLADHYPID